MKIKLLNKLKEDEKGSITVFVLSTMLVVVGVVFTMYFSMKNKTASQKQQLEKIQEEYNQSNTMMQQVYDQTINQ